MDSHELPRSVQAHISKQRIGAETLLYDGLRHKAFCLNESSSIVWRLANGERSIAQICAAAGLELKTSVSEELVLFAVEELRRDGLMEPSIRHSAGQAITRRIMLQRLGVGGAMLLPVISAIVAPTAAQAYSGCFDCATAAERPSEINQARARALQRRDAAKK
jgi:hypothetical protein